MDLGQELAKGMRPNELDRINCACRCPLSATCCGAEAIVLAKLRLAEIDAYGFRLTRLGQEVMAKAKQQANLPPNLG